MSELFTSELRPAPCHDGIHEKSVFQMAVLMRAKHNYT